MDRTWSKAEVSSVPWDSDLYTLVRWVGVASSVSADCTSLGVAEYFYIFDLCGKVLDVSKNIVPV